MPILKSRFNDLTIFNNSIQDIASLNKTSESFSRDFGCRKGDLLPKQLRFQVSWWCMKAISDAIDQGCSPSDSSAFPKGPNFCLAECSLAARTVSTVLQNTTLCPATTNTTITSSRSSLANGLAAFCSKLRVTSNSTADSSSTCFHGVATDVKFCGWNSLELAKAQCKGLSDSCCKSLLASSGLSPLIIGVIIGAAILILVLLGVGYYIISRRRSTNVKPESKAPEPFAKDDVEPAVTTIQMEEKLLTVIHPYESSMQDELNIVPGDQIILIKEFDDGWAQGKHIQTGKEGVFPMICVESSSYDHPSASRMTMVSEAQPAGESPVTKRTSSVPWDRKSIRNSGNYTKRISSQAFVMNRLTMSDFTAKSDVNPFKDGSK
jgi:hypothetical protein